ncbi:MAG TPA: biotin/lipoyl-containing protein, partial [Ramlibacter sp.]|nr:biotin/lipoyl-containing protein [Ramlibacter sp.]
MASIEVKVPDIGDFDEVSVIELLVKTGDTVKAEQSLVTVESDKASMEIPSSSAGVVKEMKVKLGDKVKEGSVLVVLDSMTTAAPSGQAGPPPPQPSPPKGEGSKAPAASAHSPAPAGEGRGEGGVGPIEIRVPDIGDFKDVAVIELLVKPGDTVKPEQS